MAEAGKGRERLPYTLNPVLTGLRDLARALDGNVEDALTELIAALEDDGVVDEREARRLLAPLVGAYKDVAQLVNVVNLLDESGAEPALREVQRHEQRRAARKRG